MKKILSLILLFFLTLPAFSNVSIYSTENKKFGLKDDKGNIILEEKYKKLIPLGENSYIALKGSKYGLIDKKGNIIIDFKYSHASRILGKFAKLKNYKGFYLLTNTETTF